MFYIARFLLSLRFSSRGIYFAVAKYLSTCILTLNYPYVLLYMVRYKFLDCRFCLKLHRLSFSNFQPVRFLLGVNIYHFDKFRCFINEPSEIPGASYERLFNLLHAECTAALGFISVFLLNSLCVPIITSCMNKELFS